MTFYVQDIDIRPIGHNKENIDTVELIAHIVKYVGVKDIQIKDMPVSDIIKKIYMGESLK